MMNGMLQETLLTGTAHRAELPGWQAAGKTGTSQEWRDAWFVGYTSRRRRGVARQRRRLADQEVSGGNLPVEIWSRFMKAALRACPRPACRSGRGATRTRRFCRRSTSAGARGRRRSRRPGGLESAGRARGAKRPAAACANPGPARRARPRPAAVSARIPPAPIPSSGAPRDKGPLSKLLGTL